MKTRPLQTGESEVGAVHLTVVEECSFQIGSWGGRERGWGGGGGRVAQEMVDDWTENCSLNYVVYSG